jgi:hypothetical protein
MKRTDKPPGKAERLYPYSFFRLLMMLILILSISTVGFGQKDSKEKKKKKNLPKVSVRVELKNFYDNNVLKYSDKYLQRFENLEDEGRFHINTADDFIVSPALSLSVSHDFIKKKTTQFNFFIRHNEYLSNSIKNWDYMFFQIKQDYHKYGEVGIKYEYIPDFYIRHFRDDDYVAFMGYVPGAFTPMAFTKENYSLFAEHRYKNSRLKLSLNYTRYFYNVHYIEYDAIEPFFELTFTQDLLDKDLRLSGAFGYKISNAKGYDQEGETLENSDDGDASFNDYTYELSARYKLPKLFNHSNNITIDAMAGRKNFTTENFVEIDELHAGRQDFNYKLEFTYRYYISRTMYTQLFYNFYGRQTTSASDVNSELVSNEKNYTQYQVGLSLSYTFNPNFKSKKKKSSKKTDKVKKNNKTK